MSEVGKTYTYRAGKRIELEKKTDQFIIRALPEELKSMGVSDAEQVSSSSSRVTTRTRDLEGAMKRSRAMAPTHHAYYVAATGKEFLITDRIFVTFREALPPAQVDTFAGRYALIQLEKYGDRDYLFQLTDHTGTNPVKLVVKLMEEEPLVEIAEHDLNQRMKRYQLPTDPQFQQQWHLHTRFVHQDFDPRSSTRCEEAWQLLQHLGSASVVVGVTDDGCKLGHPDFNSPGKFAAWGYFRGMRLINNADIDADQAAMYTPGEDHGTSCAGVIAAEADSLLTVGAAPGCRLLPIKWEINGPFLLISDSKILTMLNFIADKVDVLSNSWGSAPSNLMIPQVVNRIRQLAQTGGRRSQGIIFLWAAGNENCPIQHTATVDIPYTDGWEWQPNGTRRWIGVETSRQFENSLAGVPGVVHVAALASLSQRSHYSNYGSGIALCAPTNNVHEYHRVTVRGLGITTTTGGGGGVTQSFGGTSSATPLVAGVAALVISANPALTALEVIVILKQTAAKDLNMEAYPRTPPASFDPQPTWDVSPVAPFDQGDFTDINDPDGTWSPWFGYGRVDAPRAVAEALARRVTTGQQVYQKTSSPGLDIPDNNITGVQDKISFAEAAQVESVKVSVDITHNYIGDLRLTLISPAGTEVVMHNRNGGATKNLHKTFDLTSTPGLSAFKVGSLQGDWTILVQDLAAADTGRLNQWGLEIAGGVKEEIVLEESPGATIPDNNPQGLERKLTCGESGLIKNIEVAVDITHSYIGDLAVTLISPGGTTISLHQRRGGSQDNLIQTFTATTTPALQALQDQPLQGDWRLRAADLAGLDVGKLNRWSVKIAKK